MRYLWAREQANSDKPHYHLRLLLNKEAFDSVERLAPSQGDIYQRQNLYHRMMRSWLKARGLLMTIYAFNKLINASDNPITEMPWTGILHRDDWLAMDDSMHMEIYL